MWVQCIGFTGFCNGKIQVVQSKTLLFMYLFTYNPSVHSKSAAGNHIV